MFKLLKNSSSDDPYVSRRPVPFIIHSNVFMAWQHKWVVILLPLVMLQLFSSIPYIQYLNTTDIIKECLVVKAPRELI